MRSVLSLLNPQVNLKQDILDAAEGKYKAFTAPFFTKHPITGKKKMLIIKNYLKKIDMS